MHDRIASPFDILLTSSDRVLMTKASHPARAKKSWAQLVRSSHGVLTPAVRRMLSAVTPSPVVTSGHQVPAGLVEELPPAVLLIASIPDTDLLLPDTCGYLDTWPLNIVLLLFQALPPQFPLEGPAAPALVLEASSVRTLGVVH